MAETKTAARPYAKAVFDLARSGDELSVWSETLALTAAVAADPSVARLASDPRVPRARVTELFLDVFGQRVSDAGVNFVRLLIENRRLALLPEIVTLFEQYKAAAEGRLDVTVHSAFPLTAAQQKAITAALKRKLGRDINLTVAVDATLVGGVIIRAGDLVIDGSVKGGLEQLAAYLNA